MSKMAMNEVEKHEFITRMKAMDPEEKKLAIKVFDDKLLFSEVERRYEIMKKRVADISKVLGVKDLQ